MKLTLRLFRPAPAVLGALLVLVAAASGLRCSSEPLPAPRDGLGGGIGGFRGAWYGSTGGYAVTLGGSGGDRGPGSDVRDGSGF